MSGPHLTVLPTWTDNRTSATVTRADAQRGQSRKQGVGKHVKWSCSNYRQFSTTSDTAADHWPG